MRGFPIQALKFGLVGLANTMLGLSVIFGAMSLLDAPPIWANLMGYGAGLTVSFVLNAFWTFNRRLSWLSLIRFVSAFAMSYTLNLILLITASRCGVNIYLSQAVAVAGYTITFFMLSKWFVFVGAASVADKPSSESVPEPSGTSLR